MESFSNMSFADRKECRCRRCMLNRTIGQFNDVLTEIELEVAIREEFFSMRENTNMRTWVNSENYLPIPRPKYLIQRDLDELKLIFADIEELSNEEKSLKCKRPNIIASGNLENSHTKPPLANSDLKEKSLKRKKPDEDSVDSEYFSREPPRKKPTMAEGGDEEIVSYRSFIRRFNSL